MRGRKPKDYRQLVKAGQLVGLTEHRCNCGRWVIQQRGTIWDVWEPWIIEHDDITVAVILHRRLTRIQQASQVGIRLIDVCGAHGLDPDGRYLEAHDCTMQPVSHTPYRPRHPPDKTAGNVTLPDITYPHPNNPDPWAAELADATLF